MREIRSFDEFLKDVVNLNATRLDKLNSSYEAIKNFLRDSDYAPKISQFFRHGSWSHKTIIRPVDGKPFDADVMMFVRAEDGWSAADYVNKLADVFEDSAVYKDKYQTYSHCVTIEYAGDRKMDIAPCVVGREVDEKVEVCNRDEDVYEETDPEGYTAWIRQKNKEAGSNYVRKVSRLLKYVRDFKGTFKCPSFLLTTLIGMQIKTGDKGLATFNDLPSALKEIIARLDDWLEARPALPVVPNPVLASENQAEVWTEANYLNFRTHIKKNRDWIDEAYAELDADESVLKWRKVFGDDFGLTKVEKATASDQLPVARVPDPVELAQGGDLTKIDKAILLPSWRQLPKWTLATSVAPLTVKARLTAYKGDRRGKALHSGSAAEPGRWIEFKALTEDGRSLSGALETHWRITNTGEPARRVSALRGDFYASTGSHSRWEKLEYRGVHQVEAFLVNQARQVVGTSEPFYVVVE